ncbi:MAG: hypothetical protein LBB77_00865 [Treponema sp.]|jgi:hypothetical protein|nr:hypothetical protein [Treponema sp.]
MKRIVPVLLIFAGFLCSCIGVKTEIALKADGTGTIHVEYRISRELMDIGILDGNTRWPGVPVGEADFERSIDGLEGLSKISFSTREEGPDLIHRITAGFSKLEDILPLLDYNGEAASLVRGEKRSLVLHLAPFPENRDEAVEPELLALAEEAFRGYFFAMSLSAPSPVEIRVSGANPRIEQGGRKAGFSIPFYELISKNESPTVEFVF